MSRYFRIDAVCFTVLGYPMSYIELIGTTLYLGSVWLMARRNPLTWPVGIVSVLLYMAIFYQIRLYSDALEQVYYLAASACGWWRWARERPAAPTLAPDAAPVRVVRGTARARVAWLAGTAVASAALGAAMSRAHQWAPAIFPEPASFPYLDASTTVMSMTAMWLMTLRRVESWHYWVAVDAIGIGLYHARGVRFIALLYVVLLGMAIHGLIAWSRAARAQAAA